MIFSEVVSALPTGSGNDAMQINGAKHIWIDHCEFRSSLTAPSSFSGDPKDYYDGLLDIKNGSRFISISNSYFHDHHKAILIGSGDDPTNAATDTHMRITFYNNYFKDITSRLPLIRFGKVHLFNNYMHGENQQIDSTVNVRCGAEVYYEKNLTVNAKKTVGFYYDEGSFPTGTWNLDGNVFTNVVEPPSGSTTSWKPVYQWSSKYVALDLAAVLPGAVGVGKINPLP